MTAKKYVSEEAGKTFSIWVGVLGVLFFMGQFILPFFGMIVFMPFATSMTFSRIEVENSTFHDGAVWYTRVQFSPPDPEESTSSSELFRLTTDRGKWKPEKVTELNRKTRLLSTGKDLWVISNDSVSRWSGEKVENRVKTRPSGSIKHLFSIRDRPAALVGRPGKRIVSVFRNGSWNRIETMQDRDSRERDGCCDRLRLLHVRDTYHLFLQNDGTVYHRTGLPASIQQVDDWEPVISDCHRWTVTEKDGRPFVLGNTGMDGFQSDFEGIEFKGDHWKRAFTFSHRIMGGFNGFSGADSNTFYVLSEGFPGSAKLVTIEDGTVTGKTNVGSGFFGGFPGFMMVPMGIMYGFMMLSPLLMAIVVSVLMSKYRITEYSHDRETRMFAPLWRRAFAQLVDLVIVGVPHLIVGGYMFGEFFSGSFPFPGPWMFAVAFGGFCWSGMVLLLFSFLEGRYGRTPGKWLFGIEVIGEDLEYCGFGRGLLRNVLKLADGFFNFMVGIIVVALTEDWQRVGDLVARTIVVRTGERPDVQRSHDDETGSLDR